MGLVWESSLDSKLDEASWELASVLSPGSVVRAVEEEAVTSILEEVLASSPEMANTEESNMPPSP